MKQGSIYSGQVDEINLITLLNGGKENKVFQINPSLP